MSSSVSIWSSSYPREVWQLIAPYWRSEDKRAAWTLFIVIIALTLGLVYMAVLFNKWNEGFYNSLQHKNSKAFFESMGWFCVLATVWILIAVYHSYLNQMLQIRWRRWITDRYLNDWLKDRTYYRMQTASTQEDNPDQRISDDARIFVDSTLDLFLGFIRASLTLVSFIGILWVLSGSLPIAVGDTTVTIPGYMVWAAILYAGVGTWIIERVGHPLIRLNNDKQRLEADFRFSLARFRENTEGVALYRGEADELQGFRTRFKALAENWIAIMKRQKVFGWWESGYSQLSVPFPYLVAAPRYFSGAIELGGMMQTANAFGQVKESLSWFINVYTLYAHWKATTDRLLGFHRAMRAAQHDIAHGHGPTVSASPQNDQVVLDGLQLNLPNGQPVVETEHLAIKGGQRLLFKGPTGCGKSTLFRAMAGIWPFGEGRVQVGSAFNALFLPQRPYFPLGNLRRALSYPASTGTYADEQLRAVLHDVGLGALGDQLDTERIWSMQLSGGEQQRIAIARALLQKPAWLFLDEATSNLDSDAQDQMYKLLVERLPGTTLISIGHRGELARFHDKVVQLAPTSRGAYRLMPAT